MPSAPPIRGARYVPGSGTPVPVAPVTNAGDPFTGANRYKPSGSTPDVASPAVTFFPLNDYVRFDQANLKAILDKLKQFTETLREKTDVSPSIVIPSEAQLDSLGTLGEPSPKAAEDVLNLLKQLLEWPPEFVFPILDLTRLGVRNVQINEALCGGRTGRQMISLLRSFLNADSSVNNQMLTLRILTNMFSHEPGEELVLSHKEYIFSILDELSHTKLIKSMQVSEYNQQSNVDTSYSNQYVFT
ncbi:phospholipase A-2-activating protein-like [Diaphorina citri]|uniref:Phospholipase A-2-activating protein-like n=1 Tax=Diaphorina citri TaxID=121845 RepID=A0A3Q0J869_DIACI|nr:phospholipase A-2-activating protein-like [Diaphorina citri]